MAAVTKEITHLLTESTKQRSVPILMQAFSMLPSLLDSVVVDTGLAMKAPNDLYLFCCETAVLLEQWPVAQQCMDRLVEAPTTTKAFQIRTLYCRAELEAERAKGLRCKELVQSIQGALVKVITGMKQALQDTAALSHLIPIGAKHVWNVGRPLFKDGTFTGFVASISFVVQALEKIDYADGVVRLNWLLRQASALAGAHRFAEANTVLQKAADTVGKVNPAIKYHVYRMQVALSKSVANPKVKQDAVKGVLRAIYASQALFCGLAEGPAAEADLVGSFNELSAELKINGDDNNNNAAAPLSPSPPAKTAGKAAPPPKKGADAAAAAANQQGGNAASDEVLLKEDALAELGLALALHGDVDRATEVSKATNKFRSLKARVFGEYAGALLRAIRCGGMAVQQELTANALTPAMIGELVTAVRDIERTLESAQRIPEAVDRNHLVQYGCVLMWNISLPLLQPNLRGQIGRSMQSAAKHLEDIQSNMGQLRALLYYEAALVDVDSDFLNKATSKIRKGLGTDYQADPEEQKTYALQRPLDRFLVWMDRKLMVRGNLYAKPDNVEDETLVVVEQARDAPPVSRLSMLTRAANLLRDSEPPADYWVESNPNAKADEGAKGGAKGAAAKPPPAKKGPAKGGASDAEDGSAGKALNNAQAEQRRLHLRTRATLWSQLLQAAWRDKNILLAPLVRQAVGALLSRSWYRKGDRDMRHLQSDAHMTLAELSYAELLKKGLYPGQTRYFPEEDDGADGEDEDEVPDDANNAQNKNGGSNGALGGGGGMDDAERNAKIRDCWKAVQEAEDAILSSLVEGAKIGVELVQQGFHEDQWIVINAAARLWNFHTRVFAEENLFVAPLPALEQLHQLLLAAHVDPKKEIDVCRDNAASLVKGYLQLYMKEKLLAATGAAENTAPEAMVVLSRQIASTDVTTFTKTDPTNPKLAKAFEVCDKMIQLLPTAMDASAFLRTAATILRLQQKPQDQRSLPQQRLLSVIEQLAHPTPVEDRRNLLNNTALDLLQMDPNVELCARLAARSLAIPNNDRVTVRIAMIGTQLYQDGRLGWRQMDPQAAAGLLGNAAKGGGKEKAPPKDKSATATNASAPGGADAAPVPSPRAEDWHWYALLLQYLSIATVQLVNPVLQDKATQWEIRSRALTAITNCAMAALQGLPEYRDELIRKAIRIYHNSCRELAVDAACRAYIFPSLRQLLQERILKPVIGALRVKRTQPSVPSDMDALSELCLLLLTCLKDQGSFEESLRVMKVVVGYLPASHHKPFWGFDVACRCLAGLPTTQTLLRVKEYDPETQAQVWVAMAGSSRNLEDQRFALQNAVDALATKPTEQAVQLLMLAQWALRVGYSGFTLANVTDIILAAVDMVSQMIDVEAEEDGHRSDMASTVKSRAGGTTMIGSTTGKSMTGTATQGAKSMTHGTNKGSSTTGGGVARRRDKNRASVKVLQVAIQAYYLLAKISGHLPPSSDQGSVMDAKSALSMMVHYVMRLWSTTLATTNAHNARQHAKQQRDLARNSLIDGNAAAAAAAAAAPLDELTMPVTAVGWVGFSVPTSLSATLRSIRSASAISPATVIGADSFVQLLDDAVEMLNREGLELQTVPVLNMMKLVIDVCFETSETLNNPVAVTARNAVSQQLFTTSSRLSAGSLSNLFLVSDPYLNANELLALNEDARIAQQKSQRDDEQEEEGGANTANGADDVVVVRETQTRVIYPYWCSLGRSLLMEGRIVAAQQLLEQAAHHATSFRDKTVLLKSRLGLAQIAFLSGDGSKALAALRSALAAAGGGVSIALWTEAKLVELEMMVHLNLLHEAFAMEEEARGVLDRQLQFYGNGGLSREVAIRVLPELHCLLTSRFATTVARAFRLSTVARQDAQELAEKLVATLRVASERCAILPAYTAQSYLLLLEVTRLESEFFSPALVNHSLVHRKRRLCQEGRLLMKSAAALREQLASLVVGSTDSVSIATFPSSMAQLSGVLNGLGNNILERLKLNVQLLQGFRDSNYTGLSYPVAEGAPAQLETHVVRFMRSTSKQRAADDRKAERRGQYEEIERRRAAARQVKQDEINKRREQRKAEEAAKPPPKGKAPPKAAPQPEEPDVDPHDKCGILSPRGSDDEGHGEDSQSDEDEELSAALRDLEEADRITEAGLTIADAVQQFTAASESAGPHCVTSRMVATHGLAKAQLLTYMARCRGTEQRVALLQGNKPASLLETPLFVSKWNRPMEIAAEEEKGAKGGKPDAKKPPAKPGAKGAAPEPVAVVVADAAPVDPYKVYADQLLAQATKTFTQAVKTLYSAGGGLFDVEINDTTPALFVDYAEALVLGGKVQAAGLAVECAVAARLASYIFRVWRFAAYPDTTEAALFAALQQLREKHEQLAVHTQSSLELNRALQASSKMLARLRVPEQAWTQPAVHEVTPFSQDVAVWSVVSAGAGWVNGSSTRFMLALRRPTGQVDLRSVEVDLGPLKEWRQAMDEKEQQRAALLAADRPNNDSLHEISIEMENMNKDLQEHLQPLWAPFAGLIDTIGPKTHVALCVDPELLPFPVETAPIFAKFRSVQRELSVFQVTAKLQRRTAEKYAGTTAALLMDLRKECPGSIANALSGDEKPRMPQWSLHTATLDENKQLRIPGVAYLQRVITAPTATNVVWNLCGRLTGIISAADLATLSLEHVRFMAVCDRGMRNASNRREHHNDMTKTQEQQWVEQPWNTALLLLARGVECLVTNRGPASTYANDMVCRTILSVMDKPQIRSYAEVLAGTFKKCLDDEDQSPEPTKLYETVVRFADVQNVVVYGLGADEPQPTKPGK